MISYSKTWLTNLIIVKQVEQQFQVGLILEDELNNVKSAYPNGFYTPGFFARIGMFILTIIISLFSCGLLCLLFLEANIINTYGWLIFLGLCHYVALEIIVKSKFHFRSGVDDALLWIGVGLWAIAFYWATHNYSERYLLTSIFVFLLTFVLTIRFTDILMSLVAYLAAIAVIFFAWQKIGALGLATMPFMLMVCSGISYILANRHDNNSHQNFYTNNFIILKIISLITLYVSGNFYVVKELNDMLYGTVSKTIPFAWIFWFWTICLPLLYIGLGLIRRNQILLRTGLFLILAAALTFRNYYHVMPIEQTLIFSGIIALVFSWWVTKYLRTPKNGFTVAEVKTLQEFNILKIESLIIAESFSADEGIIAEEPTFGGGKFGGGGASSNF